MQTPQPASERSDRKPVSRLVLVEDDENVRRSMTMMLRARGFSIDAYRSGAEFLTMQGQHDADCLLIDYKMPRIDGLEVMRRLRKRKDDTPAIMITGFFSSTLRGKALSVGYADILEKPATPTTMIEAVNAVLGHDTPETPQKAANH